MRITSKEILLWQILKKKIEDINDGIAGQTRIIELHVQMDYRHNRRPGDYSKLQQAITMMHKRKNILLRKFDKIDEKIEVYAEEI